MPRATVISSSRRFVSLCLADGQNIQAKASAKALEIAVGDRVQFESREGDNFITAIEPRKNELARGYRGELRVMASNLDLILIVAAVGSGFNSIFVDKVLSFAFAHDIPTAIIVNKIDKGIDATQEFIDLYRQLGQTVFCLSAKYGTAMEDLTALLQNPAMNNAALVGISGVGKSTLLNRFSPDARLRTQEVNERTGLGRQTTTQAIAHPCLRACSDPLFLVDLPGLQSFGVGHLNRELIAESFPEIASRAGMCEFSDCGHIKEKVCAIQQAVADGEIAASRYNSYLKMLEEVEEHNEY